MSNYFDNKNNQKFKWDRSDGRVKIIVDHGDHSHSLDISKAKSGDLLEKPNEVLGNAHRASGHDKK